jgi:alkanesulfonate monooxygenase SsuD/methylene tetrahydromethanopterin reductase-like flavin-dependent oxidoreductase (luciferase family)
MLLDALHRGGKRAVAEALPRRLIENTTACGTPDEVLARVERYRRAGITLPLIRAQARHRSPAPSICSRAMRSNRALLG